MNMLEGRSGPQQEAEMRALMVAIAAGALLTLPADALAQSGRASGTARGATVERREGRVYGTTRDRRDDRLDRRDRDRDRYDRRDDRYNDRYRGKKGPKFCQNGQGHPVHGRAWCRQKGYDVGRGYIRWDRVSWDDVIFNRRDRRHDSRFGSSILRDILGGRVYGRLDDHRRSAGYADGLVGAWGRSGNGYVLNVYAGDVPIAQLIDANHDGRVEAVLLNRR